MPQPTHEPAPPAEVTRLSHLVEASRMLNSSLELDVILANLMDLASSLLSSERSTLFLIDEEKQELWSRVVQQAGEIRIPLTSGIAGRVATTGAPILTDDAYELPFFNRQVDQLEGFRTRSVLCVPLRNRRGKVIGTLQTLNKTTGSYTSDDCAFLEDLGAQAAVAIENALLHERLLRQQALERDLQIAARIQQKFLPTAPLQTDGMALEAFTEPVRQVGGDFYDYLLTPRGTVLFAIGDVSGKGIPAALMMSNLLAGLRILAQSSSDPRDIVERLNRFMEGGGTEMFCTAFLGELDPASRVLRYCNAGHLPGLLLRGDGEVEKLEEGGMPLGILRDSSFDSGRIDLASGDHLFLYTDGLVEARNPAGELFGLPRLLDILAQVQMTSPGELVARMRGELLTFSREAPRSDDLTLLALRAGEGASAPSGRG